MNAPEKQYFFTLILSCYFIEFIYLITWTMVILVGPYKYFKLRNILKTEIQLERSRNCIRLFSCWLFFWYSWRKRPRNEWKLISYSVVHIREKKTLTLTGKIKEIPSAPSVPPPALINFCCFVGKIFWTIYEGNCFWKIFSSTHWCRYSQTHTHIDNHYIRCNNCVWCACMCTFTKLFGQWCKSYFEWNNIFYNWIIKIVSRVWKSKLERITLKVAIIKWNSIIPLSIRIEWRKNWLNHNLVLTKLQHTHNQSNYDQYDSKFFWSNFLKLLNLAIEKYSLNFKINLIENLCFYSPEWWKLDGWMDEWDFCILDLDSKIPK